MNRLFGSSSKAAPKPTLNDAITSTDARASSLEVKVAKLDGELAKYRDQLAKMKNGPGKTAVQQRAIGVLRQKKMVEAQLSQLQQQSFNMESAAMATDSLRSTMATVDAMKTANKEMKKQYGKINVDQIESMHDEMADLLEAANEVQESLGRSYAVPDDIDEAELEAELEALSNEIEADEEPAAYLADVQTAPDFIDEAPIEHRPTEIKAPVAGS